MDKLFSASTPRKRSYSMKNRQAKNLSKETEEKLAPDEQKQLGTN